MQIIFETEPDGMRTPPLPLEDLDGVQVVIGRGNVNVSIGYFVVPTEGIENCWVLLRDDKWNISGIRKAIIVEDSIDG